MTVRNFIKRMKSLPSHTIRKNKNKNIDSGTLAIQDKRLTRMII